MAAVHHSYCPFLVISALLLKGVTISGCNIISALVNIFHTEGQLNDYNMRGLLINFASLVGFLAYFS